MTVPINFEQRDLADRLRSLAASTYTDIGADTLRAAAAELERLRGRVFELERLRTDRGQYEKGYAKAQRDIRRALGIED